MARDDQYFASLPVDKIGDELYAKVMNFYTAIESAGYFAMVRKSYLAYYGSSGANTSTGRMFNSQGIRRQGTQGELYDFKVNNYRNLIQHMLTMITSEKPALEAMAVNTDHASQIQAELGSGLLEYYMTEKRLERYLVEACEKALWAAAGHVGVLWNPNLGRLYQVRANQVVYEGDIEVKAYSPLDVIIDPTQHTRASSWKITRDYVNKWDLVAEYPDMKEDILKISSIDGDINRYLLSKNMAGSYGDEIPTFNFYHDRSQALPNGRMTTFLPGGKVLFDGDLPYKKLPIYSIMPARIDDTPFGYTTAFDMLSIQEALDILYSVVLSNQATFGVQNVLLPKNHDIRIQALGQGLRVIEYDPQRGEPKALQLTATPAEIFRFIADLEAAQEKIMGLNSVVRGQPSGQLSGASGAAMALLASQAIQFSYGLQREYEFLIEDVGTAILQTLQMYAATDRVALIVGKDKRSYSKSFSSSDINLIDRALVKRIGAISKTTAGKADLAKTLIDSGMIKTPEEYLSVIKTGNLETLIEGDRSQLLLIKSENEALKDGRMVPAIATDQHSLHIREHGAVLADPDTRENPQLVANVLAHINEHINLLKNTDPALLSIIGEKPLQPSPIPPQGPVDGDQYIPEGLDVAAPFETTDAALQDEMPRMPNMPSMPDGTPPELEEAYQEGVVPNNPAIVA